MEVGVRTSLAISVAAVLLALALRMPGVGSSEVWIDEAVTQFAVSRDWLPLIENRVHAGHSPVYFLLLKVAGVDALDLYAMRTASVVLDALACGILAFGAARLFGPKTAIFTALFYAMSPHLVIWAQNARPYSMLMLALAIGLLGAMEMLRRYGSGSPRDWIWPGIAMSAGLTLASLTLTGGVIATAMIALSPLLSRECLRNRPFLKAWAIALVLPAIACGAMAYFVSAPNVAKNYGDFWAEKVLPFSIGTLARLASHLFLGELRGLNEPILTALSERSQLIAGLILATFLGAFLVIGGIAASKTFWQRPLVLLAFGYPVVLIAMSTQTSLLVPRYFSPSLVAGSVLAGAGLAWGWDRLQLRPIIVVLLAVSGLAAVSRGFSDGYPRSPESKDIASFLTGAGKPNLNILVARQYDFPIDLRLEVMLAESRRPGTPVFIKASTEKMLEVIDTSDRPTVVVDRLELWESELSKRLPVPDCFVVIGSKFVASYGAILPDKCP